MQFKIIHNIYPCGLKLKHWRIFSSSTCLDCNQVDTLNHHLYNCIVIQTFWSSIEKWWNDICPTCDCEFNREQNILLGCIEKSCHQYQINYIILAAKWYIYRTKYLKGKCFALDFLIELKAKLKVEEYIYKKTNKYSRFIDLWWSIQNMM